MKFIKFSISVAVASILFNGCSTKTNISQDTIIQDGSVLSDQNRIEAFIEHSTGDNLKIDYSDKPFQAVSNQTEKYINRYIKNSPNVVTKVPKNIQIPELPPIENLQKGRFEKTVEFEDRVKKAVAEREAKLLAIQEKYRKDVEERNQIVRYLQNVQNKPLTYNISRANFQFVQDIFTNKAVKDVMGGFKIIPKDYNADTEILLVEIKANNANYSKTVTLKINRDEAQKIYNNPASFSPNVDFKVENSTVALNSISVNNIQANIDSKFNKAEEIEVAINNQSVNFSKGSREQMSVQSANLQDYKIDQTKFIDSKFIDDLPNLLEKSNKAQPDNRKWAFIVGVEKYRDTDSVPFSKRSSEMLKDVFAKSLGVPERNIYILVDEDATTTAIKDSMRKMSENIKNGDAIYFYYSGHGVPSSDGKAYILPQDKFVDYVHEDRDLQLDQIYKKLTDTRAGKVIAFVDSCFSGKTGANADEVLFKGKGTAGIYAREISTQFDKKRMAVLTAGTNSEFSNMFDERGHRLFSYFLMRDIISGEKNLSQIHLHVRENVFDKSSQKGDRYKQTPQIYGNNELEL